MKEEGRTSIGIPRSDGEATRACNSSRASGNVVISELSTMKRIALAPEAYRLFFRRHQFSFSSSSRLEIEVSEIGVEGERERVRGRTSN